jgi:hypothetical protein
MFSNQHTPTPWRKVLAPLQIVTDDEIVCDFYSLSSPIEKRYANADYIVRAANCHQELVECLKEAYRYLDPESKYAADILHTRIGEAIAKAEDK